MNLHTAIVIATVCFLFFADRSTARPSPPPTSMAVILPEEFSKDVQIPLRLAFHFSSDEDRKISTEDIECLLLDESGNQVALDCFNLADQSPQIVMKGTDPTFEPALRWNDYATAIVTGKRYQLVCVWRSVYGPLAGSAWFTLSANK